MEISSLFLKVFFNVMYLREGGPHEF